MSANLELNADALSVYRALLNFSDAMAHEAKDIVYDRVRRSFSNSSVVHSLHKLSSSPIALDESDSIPLSEKECAHQFIRAFLHMHDEQLHAVIIAYMRLHYEIISDADAFTALIFVIQREITVCFNCSESWDIAMLRESLKPYKIDRDNNSETDEKQYTVLVALHHGLKTLGLDIVWIEWIANWKNTLKLLYAKHSPLHWITRFSHIEFKCFPQEKMDNFFTMDYFGTPKKLPSVKQCTKYLAQLMFGCNLVKDQDDRWILDNPLTPTHELNTGLDKRHPKYNLAKRITQGDYDVMKPGRLWETKKQDLLNEFLVPDRRWKPAWGYNAQYLVLLDSEQFLVEYDPQTHGPVLPCQKIETYKYEKDLKNPKWDKTSKSLRTTWIDNQTFLHIGPKRSEVQKRIWYTRNVWKQKLGYMKTAINNQEFEHWTDERLIETLKSYGYDPKYSEEGFRGMAQWAQWVKLAEEQGEIVRIIKEDMKADPASHTKEELDAAVAKLTELKAKVDYSIIFKLIRSFSEWIEYCSDKDWWFRDKVGNADGNRFTSRLARIVYQVFDVHTIWTEVEANFLQQAENFVISIPPKNYQVKEELGRNQANWPKEACEIYRKLFEQWQPAIRPNNQRHWLTQGFELNRCKNVMIRKWLYDIEDIGPHPLKYELQSTLWKADKDRDQARVFYNLREIIKKKWNSEQTIYGGDKSSFTYIWLCPYEPLEIQKQLPSLSAEDERPLSAEDEERKVLLAERPSRGSRDRPRAIPGPEWKQERMQKHVDAQNSLKVILHNKVMTLTAHMGISEDYITKLAKTICKNVSDRGLSFIMFDKQANTNLILAIAQARQEVDESSTSWIAQCVLNVSSEMSVKSDSQWVKYEEETDPSSKSTKSIFVFFDALYIHEALSDLEDPWGHVQQCKQHIFDQLKLYYNPAFNSRYQLAESTWLRKPLQHSDTKAIKDSGTTAVNVKMDMPFTFQTHGFLPVKQEEVVFFAHTELAAFENIHAQVQFTFKCVKVKEDGNCLFHSINHSFKDFEPKTLRILAANALHEACENNLMYHNEHNEFSLSYVEMVEQTSINEGYGRYKEYIRAFETDTRLWPEDYVVKLMADIIKRTIIVYQRNRGVPPAISGLIRFVEFHKLANDYQLRQLKSCDTMTALLQVFSGSVGDESVDRTVQAKACEFSAQWQVQQSEKLTNVWQRQSAAKKHFLPPWKQWKHGDPDDDAKALSNTFYGPLNEDEAREFGKHWWPDFWVDRGSTKLTEVLLQEVARMAMHNPSHPDASCIEPVRVLYNGNNHYEALEFVSSSEQDTRAQWLREELAEKAKRILQSRANQASPGTENDANIANSSIMLAMLEAEESQNKSDAKNYEKLQAAGKDYKIDPDDGYGVTQAEAERGNMYVKGITDLDQELVEAIAREAPYNDSSAPSATATSWADEDDSGFFMMDFSRPAWERRLPYKLKSPTHKAKQINILNVFANRVQIWTQPESKYDQVKNMNKAKYLLYLLYSDVQSLINRQTYAFVKEHMDSITRHQMELQDNRYQTTPEMTQKQVVEQSWKKIEDRLQWIGDEALRQIYIKKKEMVDGILQQVIRERTGAAALEKEKTQSNESSETSSSKENTSDASDANGVIKNKSSRGEESHSAQKYDQTPTVFPKIAVATAADIKEVEKRFKQQFQKEIAKQANYRDVQPTQTNQSDETSGGGHDSLGDFGGFEFVPSPRGEKGKGGNGGTHGQKDGTDRGGRQHGQAAKLNNQANESAEGRNGQSYNPRPTGPFTNNDEACISNIYLVTPDCAPVAFRSDYFVLAIPLRAARDDHC